MEAQIDIPEPFIEWKPILKFDGKYEASSLGEIRNMRTGHILKASVNSQGYKYLSLGRGNSMRVHRIIAATFIPNPKKLRDVNHKNGNKLDNRVDNLEWLSHSDNEIHKVYKLRTPGKLLKPMRRVVCIENGKTYCSIAEACRDLNIKTNHISEACQGKISQTCGYHWRYADGN